MLIWFDTEFIDNGRTIELLSIGLVRQDGNELYLEPKETDRSQGCDWIRSNVIPYLCGPIAPCAEIARKIIDFVGPKPEFWADYAAYDWVALCQLYGRMVDIPDGWPWYCRDVRWLRDRIIDPVIKLPQFVGNEHNALDDARHCRRLWDFLRSHA